MASSEDVLISIIDRIKKDPDFRKRFLEALGLDDYVRRRDISEILEEIRNIRLDMKEMFAENDKKFEKIFQKLDENDKKFEKIFQKLEEHDKKLGEHDKKFDEIFKRFDRIDSRFDKVFQRFDELSFALGHDFEEFNSLWLQDMLRAEGFPKLEIKKKIFIDENYEVFPDSKEVEVDIFNEDPLIIGEVTAITKKIDKITTFLRKVQFLSKKFGKQPYAVIYITYAFDPKIRDEAISLLKKAGVRLYALRDRKLIRE